MPQGWDQFDREGAVLDASPVRLPKGFTEETVLQRLSADRGVSMRSAARTAAADELDGSSTQITDLLLFIVIFFVFYHGFLLFTKKRGRGGLQLALQTPHQTSTHGPTVISSSFTELLSAHYAACADVPFHARTPHRRSSQGGWGGEHWDVPAEQVRRVAALAYAEVEAWSTTHAPAVWAVALRLAGHAETARVAVATAWAEV
jgi:hypothetical protein